jgi:hypothetical protein
MLRLFASETRRKEKPLSSLNTPYASNLTVETSIEEEEKKKSQTSWKIRNSDSSTSSEDSSDSELGEEREFIDTVREEKPLSNEAIFAPTITPKETSSVSNFSARSGVVGAARNRVSGCTRL